MDKISSKVEAIQDDLIRDRRYFHAHPETGFFTFFTTAVIANRLKNLGFTLKMGRQAVKPEARAGLGNKEDMAKYLQRAEQLLTPQEREFLPIMEDGLTGLVAEIDTKRAGKNLAFRFDIDGVDVTESKSDAHRPVKDGFRADIDGVMHACGHDGHASIGLGLAKIISENLDDFSGKFTFIFQTAEEGTRGAVAMEQNGVLQGIDVLLGGHIGFSCKKNRALICGTKKLLATSKFDVNFTGKSAHAAGAPQDGANALLAAAQAAISMHGITRHSDGVTRVNVGVLRAGEGRNVIAPNGFLACETRGESTELNEFMFERCMDILKGVSAIYGVDYDVKMVGGTSGGDSSDEVTEIFYKAAKNSPYIDDDLIERELNFGACEDFAHFMQKVQKSGGISGYLMIGTELAAGHHNSCFDFDESALKTGVDLFLRSAYEINGRV